MHPSPLLRCALALSCIVTTRAAAQGNCSSTPREARTVLARADRAASDAALRDGLGRSLTASLADDGILLYSGAPILVGRVQYAGFLQAQHELDSLQVQWQPLRVTVSADCTLGMTFGDIAVRRADQNAIRHGRYIAMWRQRAGGWRLVAYVATGVTQSPPAPSWSSAPEPALGVLDPITRPFAETDLAFARQARESGVPGAFAAFVAGAGVTFAGTGELLVGPEMIRDRMSENDDHAEWQWAPVFAAAAGSGDLGFTVGTATITRGAGASRTVSRTKYLTVWGRSPGNELRFIVDGGNSLP